VQVGAGVDFDASLAAGSIEARVLRSDLQPAGDISPGESVIK
jgi:hypothetical protein